MRPSLRVLAIVALAALLSNPVFAQDRELDRAEESGQYGRGYETGNLRRPGARDPFDHTASFDVGVYRDRDSNAVGSSTLTLLPMRLGLETLVGDHWQVRGRFGIAGAVESTDVTGVGSTRERTFRPGNVALGSYYTMGGDDGKVMWTVGGGGQLSLPTAQPGSMSSGEFTAYVGSAAVHGMEDAWLFMPKTFSIVPGGYARFAMGPIFANARVDVAFNIPTDDRNAIHLAQFRVEAGYRGSETLRVGLAYTNAIFFGSNASGDRSQGALRVFLRADVKILTLGCELVMNLDDPFGFAFDDGGIWGVVSTVGISL